MLTKSLEYALNIIITIFCTNTCNLYNNHQREHVWEYIPTNRQLLYNHTFHPTPSFLLEKRIIWIFLSNSSQSLIHWISPMASLSLQLAMPRVKKTTAIKNNFKFILSYSRWILPFSYEMSNLRMILCHDFWCIYTQKKCNQRKCNGTIDFIWLFRVFNGSSFLCKLEMAFGRVWNKWISGRKIQKLCHFHLGKKFWSSLNSTKLCRHILKLFSILLWMNLDCEIWIWIHLNHLKSFANSSQIFLESLFHHGHGHDHESHGNIILNRKQNIFFFIFIVLGVNHFILLQFDQIKKFFCK